MTEARRLRVVLLGPALHAVSGVSTHLRLLLDSPLAQLVDPLHFQVGSEGRSESGWQKKMRLVTGPFAFLRYLRANRTDIVHLNTSFDNKAFWRDLGFLIVARLLGQRIVYQVHGSIHPHEFLASNFLLRAILRHTLLASDIVCVLSQAELPSYHRFDPKIRVCLLPNAIDSSALVSAQRAFNANEPLRLCFVGRLIGAKGLLEAVRAVARLRDAGRKLSFDIAGEGADRALIEAEVARLNLADHVRFHGSVFGAAKDAFWLQHDLFVFPTYNEGLPYALLEGMAAGCVPVTTPVGAIPDVVHDGQEGLLVPVRDAERLADAIARLDDDRALLHRMAAAGRSRVDAEYSIQHLAQSLADLYRQVVGGVAAVSTMSLPQSSR